MVNNTKLDRVGERYKTNSLTKVLLYALNKEDAFAEMRFRYGSENANQYSLIAYTEVEKFSLVIN